MVIKGELELGDPAALRQSKCYLFARRYASGKRVLDLGCGPGYGAAILAETAREVVAVNHLPEAIRFAKRELPCPNVEYMVARAGGLPFEDGSFDAAVCLELLEGLGEPDALISEVKRVLRPSGLAIFSCGARGYFSNGLDQLLRSHFPEVNLYGQGSPGDDVAEHFSDQEHPGVIALCHKRRITLSLCMIVKDEEEYLPRCLESVRGVADEVIVVDTGSSDGTVDIAKSFGARVYHYPWTGNFSEARNVSLEYATGDWVIFLDADEELVPEDRAKLRELLHDDCRDGFFVSEISFVGERPGLESVINPAFRLFRNSKEHRFTGAIHEQIVASVQRGGGQIGFSNVRIYHYGYLNKPCVQKSKVSRNLEILLREVEDKPTDNFTRFNLGVEYMRQGKYDLALDQYKKAFHRLPSLDVAYGAVLVRNIVLCLKECGRCEEALQVLEDAVLAYQDYTDLEYLRALVYMDMRQYSAAIRSLQRCLELGESGSRHITQTGVGGYKAWAALGDVYRKLGNVQDAVKAYTRALKLKPGSRAPLWPLGELLIPREGPWRVKEFFETLVDPASPEALEDLAFVFKSQGAYDVALEYLERAAPAGRERPRQLLVKGECLLNLRKYHDAARLLERVPPESEYGAAAAFDMAFCLAMLGRSPEALERLEAAFKGPDYFAGAIAYCHFVQVLEGSSIPRPPVFTRPLDRESYESIVWSLLDKLLELEELEAFEKALVLLDAAGTASRELKLGKLYYKHGFVESAAEELLRAAELGQGDAECYAMLGAIARGKGYEDEAETFYYQALGLGSQQESHYLALMSLLLGRAKYRQAKELLAYASQRLPPSELIEESRRSVEALL